MRDSRFLTISSLHRKLSPTRTLKWPGHSHVQITCNTSSVFHMQHVMYPEVRRDSSAIKFDRVEIAFFFFFAFVLLAEPLNRWRREENRVPRENPRRWYSENATYYGLKIQAPSETRTPTLALVAGKESRRANRYTMQSPAMYLGFSILGEIFAYMTVFKSSHWGSHIPSSWIFLLI